jgi:hypothetical protein
MKQLFQFMCGKLLKIKFGPDFEAPYIAATQA